jgi:hypothetical protein
MKKTLIAMMMLLTLSMGVQAAGQKHRHTPREQEELVDSTSKGGIDVFSDTTSVDTAVNNYNDWDDDESDIIERKISHFIDTMDSKDFLGAFVALGVLLILFVLAPFVIIVAIFYFINKNRKDKMRIAEMAMQQGQPIPEQLLEDNNTVSDEYQKGLRQCFVGVGLMVFLGLTAGEVGFGIGALVFCIGLGKIVAGKIAERKNNYN